MNRCIRNEFIRVRVISNFTVMVILTVSKTRPRFEDIKTLATEEIYTCVIKVSDVLNILLGELRTIC